jgi:hypothetical protein
LFQLPEKTKPAQVKQVEEQKKAAFLYGKAAFLMRIPSGREEGVNIRLRLEFRYPFSEP